MILSLELLLWRVKNRISVISFELWVKPEKRLQEESEKRRELRAEAIKERLALEEREKLERLQAPEDQSEEISEQTEASIEKSKT